MSGGALVFLGGAMAIFLCAASALRTYVNTGQVWLIVVSLALYGVGNLLMVRLMRESGMAVAISISAVLQLVLATLVAVVIFAERPSQMQWAGIVLGIVAVALIAWPKGAV